MKLGFWNGWGKQISSVVGSGGGGGVQYETPSYANVGGTGDRTALIVVSSDLAWNLLPFSTYGGYLVDGTQGNDLYMANSQAITGKYVEWDFTTPKKFDKIKFYFDGIFNCGAWKVQGYINNAWVDGTAIAQLGASATQEITIDFTGATKLRILGTGGTSSWDQYFREVEFSLGAQF